VPLNLSANIVYHLESNTRQPCASPGTVKSTALLSLRAFAIIMALVLSLGWPSETAAYAVLAHQAIIDSVWDTNIRPLTVEALSNATAEELKEAHGYAYGGAIIQRHGLSPHGSFFFSDLTHYVRSGDFVLALLHDSEDLDGYAFALGALAHYASDNEAHPLGTNRRSHGTLLRDAGGGFLC